MKQANEEEQQQLEGEEQPTLATIPTGSTTNDVEPMPLFVLDLQVCENLTSISHSLYLYLYLYLYLIPSQLAFFSLISLLRNDNNNNAVNNKAHVPQ